MARFRWIVLGALVLPLCAQAAAPPASHPAAAASAKNAPARSVPLWRTQTRAALVKRGDVDGYLAAVTLTHGDARARVAYAEDAVHAKPDDADALWMRWWACATDQGCDGAAMLAPIRKLEPDNAAAWVPDVTVAMKAGDPFKVTDALKRVAQGTRFDDHAWTIGRRAGLAIIALPPPPRQTDGEFRTLRLLYSASNVGAMGMPGVYRIALACTNLMFFQARRVACQKIAKLLQTAGSQTYEMIGLSLAGTLAEPVASLRDEHASGTSGTNAGLPVFMSKQAATNGDPAVVALQEKYRVMVWRLLAWGKLSAVSHYGPALGKVIRDAIRTQPNQVAMITSVLRARGVALQPPPGWQPGQASNGK